MSRADREKSLYIIRLNQIRDELRSAFPEEFAEMESLQSDKKGINYGMHGLTALEQINEKLVEEYLSQEEEEDDEDGKVDREPDFINASQKQELLARQTEKRTKDVQRVTEKLMQVFNTPPKRQRDMDDIASCLLETAETEQSIFSRDFHNEEQKFLKWNNANLKLNKYLL